MPSYRPKQASDFHHDRETPRWRRLLWVVVVVVAGLAGFVGLDWLLGTQLAIPGVRVGTVVGAITWLLLAPLLLSDYR